MQAAQASSELRVFVYVHSAGSVRDEIEICRMMSMIRKSVIIGLFIMALVPIVTGLNETETLCDLGFYEYCEPELVWATQNQTLVGSCPNQTSARDLMARSWCDFLH
jgi:hypothetical protein